MADEHLKKIKRSREERTNRLDDDDDPSLKKINLNITDLESSSNDSNSPPTFETGVFDFPWMKQGVMKSDLKFEDEEDAFVSSLNASKVSEIFKDDDRLIVNERCCYGRYDRAAVQRKEVVNDGDDVVDDDGLECVWDSLLNQKPLSNIEFEAGGLF